MNAVVKHSEERLMKVLLAPVISEKATMVAEKNEQIVFLGEIGHDEKVDAYNKERVEPPEL